jgi:cytochrome c553
MIVAALPLGAYGASSAQRQYDEVLKCKPDMVHGKELFETCAACHGTDGSGTPDGNVPAIAGQHLRVIARELVDYRHDKRWDERMQHFSDKHHLSGAQEIADVAAYISDLQPTLTLRSGRGENLDRGADLYARLCASCHGAAAEGANLKRYPRLAGQHYEYLLRQMHDAVEGRRPNLARAHVSMLARFEPPDFVAVADYLSRLGT